MFGTEKTSEPPEFISVRGDDTEVLTHSLVAGSFQWRAAG
jgi:hypothetical protein